MKSFFEANNISVKKVSMLRSHNSASHKGFAYVELSDLAQVPAALFFNNQVPTFQKFPILIKSSEAEKNIANNPKLSEELLSGNVALPSSLISLTSSNPLENRLYVGNIHASVDEESLRTICKQFGDIEAMNMKREVNNGVNKCYAFIKYRTAESYNLAKEKLPTIEVAGRFLKVGGVKETVNIATLPGSEPVAATPAAASATAAASGGESNWKLDSDDGRGYVSLTPHNRQMIMAKLAHGSGITVPAMPSTTTAAPVAAYPTPAPVPVSSNPSSNFITGTPTPYLLIQNLFDPSTETEPQWDIEILEDILDEVYKILHLSPQNSVILRSHVDKFHPKGRVYLLFSDVAPALTIANSFGGRFFSGNPIECLFLTKAEFESQFL